MPSGSASDVPHAIHTSHLIARRPETFFFPLTDSDTGKIALFREAGAVDLSSSEAARARGIALARLLDRGEQPESSATVEKLLREARIAYPDDSAICEALGLVLEKQERTFEASVIWKTGLKSDPTNESILFRLGRLCHDSGDLDTAADVLQAFIERNPWHAAVYGRYAHVLGLQGRLSEAIASAERAIQLDPSLIQVRGWLIEAYRVTGQDALAREQQEIYHRMLPITGLPDETGQPK